MTQPFWTQCNIQQLERRDPTQEGEDEDDKMEDSESVEEEDPETEEEDENEEEEPDLELRGKIEEALRASRIEPADNSEGADEEEEIMDDEQMMAIDDQLTEIFRSRVSEKKGGKGGNRRCCRHLLVLTHDFRCQRAT